MSAKFIAQVRVVMSGFAMAGTFSFLCLGTGDSLVARAQEAGTPQQSKYYSVSTLTLSDGTVIERAIIGGPPVPPPGFEVERQAVSLPEPDVATGISVLTVPAFNWVMGCSAVSGAMIAGYYDRSGLSNMYTGPANGGVMPLNNSSWPTWSDGSATYPSCPLIASRNGVDGRTTRGSLDDYWIQYGSTASDPYITGGWTQHTWATAIGDYMKTSQSAFGNSDGSTKFYNYASLASPFTCASMASGSYPDGTLGRRLFYEARGYAVTDCYNQKTDNTIAGGFSFAQFKAEINAGRPVMLNLAGHTIVGVGYDDLLNLVYLHDTWDYANHTMTWGGSYAGMELRSVSIVNVQPVAVTPSLSISDVSITEGHSGTTNATFTVSLSKASSGTVSVAYQTANGTATAVTNATTPVANSASLAIPSSGAATPYPSSITVPAGLGSLQKVTATLRGFSHTWPADVDVLVVGPAGQSVVLMSDVGSSIGATNLTFVFDDSGPALGTGALASGTYRPTNVSTGDSWPSPAPAGPYGTALSAFNGRDPAGVWTLYVVDDTASYAGSISGGWSLTLTTPGQTGDYTSASGTLIIAPGATSGSVTVAVRGDTAVEPNETFFVNLSSASNATIGDGQGIGTIVNDDGTRGDFTGDLKSDILWRHATRGEVWLWPMDGAARVTETRVETVPDTGYQIVGTGDFNGDGMTDILWHHATRGEVWIWPMNGTTRLAETRVGTVPDTGYQIVGTGDFNGDGMADILWHHAMRGEVWVWLMHGTTMVSETKVATVPDVEYRIVGTGDFNGDGRADILWHHATRGEVWVWLMNGATRISETRVETVPDTGYRIVGVADYTGDGRADILWHHATRGEVWIWPMNGTTRVTETRVGTVPDTGYQIVGTGDYNGDYKADILWHHATRGEVWVWPMNGTTMMSETKVATVPDVGYQIVK